MKISKNSIKNGSSQILEKRYGIMWNLPSTEKIASYGLRTENTLILPLRIFPDMETGKATILIPNGIRISL